MGNESMKSVEAVATTHAVAHCEDAECAGARAAWRCESSEHAAVHREPSAFAMLYESCDKRLCLFESRDGHLVAADASKFA